VALKPFILRSVCERDPGRGWVRIRNRRSDRVRAREVAAGDRLTAANGGHRPDAAQHPEGV
jgi:hypothetical protein